MPITPVPNRIELSNFIGGYNPDASEAAVGVNESPDLSNLLLDRASGHPVARTGYARLPASFASAPTTHWIRHLNYFERISSGQRERWLVAILSDGTDTMDNIQVWVYSLDNDTFERVDTVGRTWSHSKTEHWASAIEGIFYGGTRGEPMYSWSPDAGWEPDAAANNVKTFVDAIDDAVDTATEYAKDYAFKKGTKVLYQSDYYQTNESIRYDTWDNDNGYSPGDLVSRKTTWDVTSSYWKSFKCIKRHQSSVVVTYPGTGTDWKLYWKKVKIGLPQNDDGDTDASWFFLPLAAKTSVGIFYGQRLWLRRDDEDDWSRLQYSAPLKPEKDQDIADLRFDPSDWAAHDDIDGDGGGWLPQLSQQRGDAIRALSVINQMLVIAMRWETHVLVGTDESQWTIRRVGDYGCTGPQAIAELAGVIYMLAPAGTLVMTDGTSVREVPGAEKVRKFLKARLDELLVGEDVRNWQPTLTAYDHKLWITLPTNPDGADVGSITVVYDPEAQSFWLTDLPVLDIAVGPQMRADRMFFSTPYEGSGGKPTIFKYADDPGDEIYTDDDPNGGGVVTTAIPWNFRSSWFQFGAAHRERRIRRAWALLDTDADVTVDEFRDFVTSPETTVTRTATNTGFREGKALDGTVHAIAIEASGAAAPATLLGFGIDTEPIRTRFHRG